MPKMMAWWVWHQDPETKAPRQGIHPELTNHGMSAARSPRRGSFCSSTSRKTRGDAIDGVVRDPGRRK
ncbi:MAG: hypothetical protein R3C45_01910 [Phycisphaerales bacterium]